MVSIIIPIYNTEQYLRQALDSIINQTYKNLQIICVNDGSTDNSLSILEEYAYKDNRIEIISQDNKGLSAVRNTALNHVKGEFLTFVDSDDWLDLDCIEKAVNCARNTGADVTMWGYIKESPNSSIPVKLWPEDKLFIGKELEKLHIRLLGFIDNELRHIEQLDSLGSACMKLYKTNLFKISKLSFISTKEIGSGEDVLANQHIFNWVNCATYVSDIFYHYRRNFSSLTHTYRPELESQWLRLFAKMEQCYKNHNMKSLVQQALLNRKALAILSLSINIVSSNLSYKTQHIKIKSLLNANWYQSPIAHLNIKHLPIHWKCYFIAAKLKATSIVILLTKIINFIRRG